MNLKELIVQLQAIYDQRGDMPVGHYDTESCRDYVVDSVEFVGAAHGEGLPSLYHEGRVTVADNPDHVMLYGEDATLTKYSEIEVMPKGPLQPGERIVTPQQ